MTPITQIRRTREANSVSVRRLTYRGWSGCYVIANNLVETLLVPQIGRIMQFRFRGDSTGPFWENPALDCTNSPVDEEGWRNYGGDKCWPAPQSDWQCIVGHAWPPPLTFDSAPMAIVATADSIRMESSVDPHYGIRIIRSIRISPHRAEMVVTTDFSKVFGSPVSVGIWVVSQMNGHGQVFALLPNKHPDSALKQITGPPPQDLEINNRLLSLRRHSTENVKIALECNELMWMDDHCMLRITGHAVQTVTSAVYTNKDPLQYVELETESAISKLRVGEQISHKNTYTLFRRQLKDARKEAAKVFEIDQLGGPGAD